MDADRLDDLVPLQDSTAVPRVLGRDEALRRGYTVDAIKHRLATGMWRRVLPHTYLTGDVLTWPDRQAAALCFAGAGAMLSAAAALVGSVRCVRTPDSLLVLVPRASGSTSRGWVRVRRTPRLPEPAMVPGPRRAPAARAVADLALETRRLDDARALVAEVVRRRLCDVDELVAELDAGPRRGSANLRRAIEEVGAGAWSAPEARAACALRRAGAPPFEQNARIDLPDGRYLVADFLWRRLRAVLEIDSVEHHFAPADLDATMDRHLVLETLGFSVIHRSPAVVLHGPAAFARDVLAWLTARATAIPR